MPKPVTAGDLGELLNELFGGERLGPVDIDVETFDIDIKERPGLTTGDGAARIAKDVIALANSGGGVIVFGKRDDKAGGFEWVGLERDDLEQLEVSRLNRAVGVYLDPPVHLVPTRVTRAGRTFVEVRVPASVDVVLAARQNDSARLFRGRIYIRTHAAESAEAVDSRDVRAVLERIMRVRMSD